MRTIALLLLGWPVGLALMIAAISLFVVGASVLAGLLAVLLRRIGLPVDIEWKWTKEKNDG